MPLYMDVHAGFGDATPDDVADAHRRDLEKQAEFGVRFLSYWFSDPSGKAFCLAEAPDEATLAACHKAAHGLMPHEIILVDAPTLSNWMGDTTTDANQRMVDGGRRHGTAGHHVHRHRGFDHRQHRPRRQGRGRSGASPRRDRPGRHLSTFGGQEVKHTGDGVFASFVSVSRAVEATIAIQQQCAATSDAGPNLAIKIGLTAGEPVEESRDLFGAAVNLAAGSVHMPPAGRRWSRGPSGTSPSASRTATWARAPSTSRASRTRCRCSKSSGTRPDPEVNRGLCRPLRLPPGLPTRTGVRCDKHRHPRVGNRATPTGAVRQAF